MPKTILLVNPYVHDFSLYDFWIKPIALLYISKYLKNYGFEIILLDLLDFKIKNRKYGTGKIYSEIIEKPKFFKDIPRNYRRYGMPVEIFKKKIDEILKPDLILMTSFMSYWYPGVFETIKILKEKFKDVKIVLGGMYVNLCYEHALLNSGADFLIRFFEFEKIFEIIENLTSVKIERRSFEEIFLNDFPDYSLYKNLNSCAILTSIGCPFKCLYCASPILYKKFIRRSPDKVFEEIKIYKNMGIKDVAFYDDALLFNYKEGFEEFLDKIIKEEIDINFHTPNGIHAKEIDENIALKLKRANFKTIRIGFESINDERLKRNFSFKSSKEIFLRAIKNLKRAGFDEIGAYVIIGLYDQSIEEIIESYAFLYENGIKIYPALFSPVPGTPYYYKWLERKNLNDPIFTNKSIYPDKPEEIPFKKYERIKDFAKILNRKIKEKINVYKEAKEFLKN
jgi:radical SAM superfamily enzyme YgiQ (UPF0313 family)